MKYLKIRIESGTFDSVFDIYYDSVSSGTRALLYDTGLPAIGIEKSLLETGEGVTVSVPDNATSIVVSSDPNAFCSGTNDPNVRDYTIPIGCKSYTVSANSGIFNYQYTDCGCNNVIGTIDATYGYTEQTFCALQDTVSAGILTVVDDGECMIVPAEVYVYFSSITPSYVGFASSLDACTTTSLTYKLLYYNSNLVLGDGVALYETSTLTGTPFTFTNPGFDWVFDGTHSFKLTTGVISEYTECGPVDCFAYLNERPPSESGQSINITAVTCDGQLYIGGLGDGESICARTGQITPIDPLTDLGPC